MDSVRRGRRQRRPRLPAEGARRGRERGAWLAIGAAILCLGRLGDLLDRVHRSTTPRPPIPRPPTSATSPSIRSPRPALVLLVRARAHELDWRLWMDGLIAALGTAALGAALRSSSSSPTAPSGTRDRSRDHPRLSDRRHPDAGARRRHRRADPLAARPDLVAAARRPRRAGRRRRRLHPAVDRRQPARRRLDRTDLPDRRRLHRRRGLAARAERDPRRRPLRRLARADGPRLLRGGDDRPLRDAVLQPRPAA